MQRYDFCGEFGTNEAAVHVECEVLWREDWNIRTVNVKIFNASQTEQFWTFSLQKRTSEERERGLPPLEESDLGTTSPIAPDASDAARLRALSVAAEMLKVHDVPGQLLNAPSETDVFEKSEKALGVDNISLRLVRRRGEFALTAVKDGNVISTIQVEIDTARIQSVHARTKGDWTSYLEAVNAER